MVLETCSAKGVPAVLERSRSGNGGHVWVFFPERVPARLTCQVGALLIPATMERRPEIDFAFVRSLLSKPAAWRLRKSDRSSVASQSTGAGQQPFVDQDLCAYEDQWGFSPRFLGFRRRPHIALSARRRRRGAVLSVRLPAKEEDADEPREHRAVPRWDAGRNGTPSMQSDGSLRISSNPDRTELPPAMIARLIRVAAFHNSDSSGAGYAAPNRRHPALKLCRQRCDTRSHPSCQLRLAA